MPLFRNRTPLLYVLAAAVTLLLPCAVSAQEDIQVEAIAARGFGVARVELRIPPVAGQPADPAAIRITEASDRVFYPAFEAQRPVRALLRDVLARPSRVVGYFLFRGNEPLRLTVHTPRPTDVTVRPRMDGPYNRLLDQWWREYSASAQRDGEQSDYPVLVDNYLTSMLAQRLDLPLRAERRGGSQRDEVEQALGLLTGAEQVRAAMMKDTMLSSRRSRQLADQPLPPPLAPPAVSFPPAPEDVQIEPIASHVPAECFYVRFGSFGAYQWFRATLAEWGGDLRNLAATRGLSYDMNGKIQRQLALKEGSLASILGPQVIADVAMIGSDTFFREGPAIGMLFHAKNSIALGHDIGQQRTAALKADPQAEERTVEIGGRKVSFLSTPDNGVRSFYAVDGDFHLVTTSRAIVERFFEAGAGKRSLAQAEEFRHARTIMPAERDYTVFIYLSDEFFRSIIGPKYRVEMARRLQATTDLELIELARLAARGEGRPHETIDDLIDGGFLPIGFGQRPDGTAPLEQNGKLVDSLRGASGTFTPIPDVDFDSVTPDEAVAYARFANLYIAQWEQMDPVLVGIRRKPTEVKNVEEVAIELHATPFAKRHYGILAGIVGQPTTRRVAPIEGNLVSLEAIVRGMPFGGPTAPHHLFAGLRDSSPEMPTMASPLGLIRPELNWLRGYVGAWPHLGLLETIAGRRAPAFDAEGYAPLALGLWQRRLGDFSVISFKQDVLAEVTPQLDLVDAEHPAQVRLEVQDLNGTRLGEFLNSRGYQRARAASRGNARFMHQLVAQLKVPEDEALQVAEDLLDARLICPLGGEYKLIGREDETPRWISTAWATSASRGAPADYVAPPLDWFRGLNLRTLLVEDSLSVNADLLVHRKPTTGGGFTLPSWPSFGGGEAVRGRKSPDGAPTVEELPPPQPAKD